MHDTPPVPVADDSGLRVWVDGATVPPGEATVSAIDHGLVAGDGVFEALKVTPAGVFAVRRHLDRLSRSAAGLGLPAPDHGRIRDAIETVIQGRPWELGKLRITWTGGRGPLGSGSAYGPGTLVVAAEPLAAPAPATGIVTTPWTRNIDGAMAGVKTTSYAENVRALAYAAERGASEGIFVNTVGNLCEGTGSNIYCVFGSEIVTPPLSAAPLAGITREVLLEWCDLTERDLTLAEAQTADEVFITSTTRDVQAVHQWDAVSFEVTGPVTTDVREVFTTRSTDDLDP
ncbi:MAG: aminotransferase class IV [Propionibacteriaceae bacterium]